MRSVWIALLVAACLQALPVARAAEPAVAASAGRSVELFRDDFSRFPPGLLSRPLGFINGAIQEYHYLPQRGVPLGPWGNAICYLDAWAAGTDDHGPYLDQVLPTKGGRMMPRLLAPLFVTGEPEWADYTVEATITPKTTDDFAGIVFRYHTNRHHFLFCLQDGDKARLAIRMPIEDEFRICRFRELKTVDFPYQAGSSYRLRVVNEGPQIQAYINDALVAEANSDELLTGKAGLSSNVPCRFRDFRVTAPLAARTRIEQRIAARTQELAELQAQNPQPKLWKKFLTPRFGVGRNMRFGDLDGDGVLDMLIAQNIPQTPDDKAVEIGCMTALTVNGDILWQRGEPDPSKGLLTSDTPFQIHDIDGDGRNEVIVASEKKLLVLNGRTGEVLKSTETPRVESYPQVNQKVPDNWPTNVSSADCIAFADLSGKGHKSEIILKDRYWNFWVYDSDLKPLWHGQGMTGHFPYAVSDVAEGRDLLAIGYALWDGSGKQLWSVDPAFKDHADAIVMGNFSGDPKQPPKAYYCGSDEGFIVVNHRGLIERHVRIGHAQAAAVGKFRMDLPGLQIMTVNFWKNPGIVSLFQNDGELLQQEEPHHFGSPMLPVNWRGDGQEFVLLSGNVREGGLLDGSLRRAVMFPDDGHPDLCAAVRDLTGDARDEIILWDQDSIWIYTQDRPFTGDQIYAPVRNPDCNDSNYRCNLSLPRWNAAARSTKTP